jgi:hypothetical protein
LVLDISVFPDERQRVQLNLVIKLSTYTATRPAALVYLERNSKVLIECTIYPELEEDPDAIDLDIEEILEYLYYEHITFVLLLNLNGERDLLAIEIDLRFTKGYKRNFKK